MMTGKERILRQKEIGEAIRKCNGDYKSVAEKFQIPESAVKETFETLKK